MPIVPGAPLGGAAQGGFGQPQPTALGQQPFQPPLPPGGAPGGFQPPGGMPNFPIPPGGFQGMPPPGGAPGSFQPPGGFTGQPGGGNYLNQMMQLPQFQQMMQNNPAFAQRMQTLLQQLQSGQGSGGAGDDLRQRALQGLMQNRPPGLPPGFGGAPGAGSPFGMAGGVPGMAGGPSGPAQQPPWMQQLMQPGQMQGMGQFPLNQLQQQLNQPMPPRPPGGGI